MKHRQITLALKRFEAAVREHAMIGCANPQDWDDIEETYDRTKAQLHSVIDRYSLPKGEQR